MEAKPKLLEQIIKQAKENNGIIRYKYPNADISLLLSYFNRIANAMLENRGKKFNNKEVESVILKMIQWTYLPKDLDPKKGILLKGHTGRGKTFLFRVFKDFLRIHAIKFKENGEDKSMVLNIVNAKGISGEFQDPKKGGYPVIEKYSKMNCLVLDDIGAEQNESKNFGNSLNVIAEIIRRREELNMMTFGTTNLNRMSDKGGYDDRTVSRINSLFNVIPMNHKIDFRTI